MKLNDDSIEAYLSGDLDQSQAAAFARLLSAHPADAARVEELRRLNEALRLAAPEVPTQRMWKNIRVRLAAGEGLVKEPLREPGIWDSLFGRLSTPSPALRWGFAGAAALLLAVGLRMNWPTQPARPVESAANQARPKVSDSRPVATKKFIAQSKRSAAPALEAKQASKMGPTEVEQALADQDVNQAMNAMLLEKESVGSRSYLDSPLPATTVGLGGAPARPQGMASRMAPFMTQPMGPNGLKVQSAGSRQYFANRRIAVYANGVVTRMTGLRGEGDVFQLDLSSGQASFGPDTHFVRLASDAGETVVKIMDRDGVEIKDNEFNAPRGADYLPGGGELRLK